MRKVLLIFLLFLTFGFADVIKDQLGREVNLPKEVNRIVVLQHQSLNVLVQIGAKDKIVGVLQSWEKQLASEYKRLFNGIEKLPTPGDLKTINFESILKLKPDVVIVCKMLYEMRKREKIVKCLGVRY
ncbi:ABC transporter substrate-binding protein [Campylobacter ureolyticus]|uniref:Periplasmic binding protein n=1 Tax=Campylobacter ureolyticus TaxID=827 RepID=A0A6N2QVG0_9BACT